MYGLLYTLNYDSVGWLIWLLYALQSSIQYYNDSTYSLEIFYLFVFFFLFFSICLLKGPNEGLKGNFKFSQQTQQYSGSVR